MSSHGKTFVKFLPLGKLTSDDRETIIASSACAVGGESVRAP